MHRATIDAIVRWKWFSFGIVVYIRSMREEKFSLSFFLFFFPALKKPRDHCAQPVKKFITEKCLPRVVSAQDQSVEKMAPASSYCIAALYLPLSLSLPHTVARTALGHRGYRGKFQETSEAQKVGHCVLSLWCTNVLLWPDRKWEGGLWR